MKKTASLLVALVAMLAIVKIADSTYQQAKENDPRAQDDSVVKRGNSFKVRCISVDAGTGAASDVLKGVDAGVHINASDWLLENDSTTCVRVGFDGTDGSHGTRIGSGCPGGATYPAHGSSGLCQSEGASVIVDQTAAHP